MFDGIRQYKQKQIFFPDILGVFTHKFYFDRKHLAHAIKKYAPRMTGKMLDYGCGSKPYKSLFINVTQYIGVDIYNNSGHNHSGEDIDVFYDGITLPFNKDEFDCIFSSQVLEHVSNINQSLYEIHRVTKSGGYVLLTLPFVFPEHEIPNDYRRMTVYGIQEKLKEKGFDILEIERLGSFIEVIFQLQLIYYIELLTIKRKKLIFKIWNFIINKLLCSCINLTGLIFNLLPNNKTLYSNILIFAKKI